jgi:hypothetical protein
MTVQLPVRKHGHQCHIIENLNPLFPYNKHLNNKQLIYGMYRAAIY